MPNEAPMVSFSDTTRIAKMTDLNPGADEVPGPSNTPVVGGDNGKSGGSTAEDESNSSGMPPVMAKPGEVGNAFVISEGASFTYGVLGDSAMSKARLVVLRGGVAEELGTQTLQKIPTGDVYEEYRFYRIHIPLENAHSDQGRNMFVVLEGLPDLAGYSLGIFTVVQNAAEVDGAKDKLQAEISLDSGLKPGFTREDSHWYIDGYSFTTSDTGEMWDPSTAASSTKALGPSNTEDVKISESDSISGGGLSDGAKAGIGAGVGVAGLILIGLLIFFFLRRRRRAARAADETSLTPANDFIRDKESHSAQVAESPHSPASEDDRARGSVFTGGEAAERAPASPVPTTGTGSGQRDVPSAMTHLVEEGMTEADIRRLEEEERALDQAIEQAGRR